MSERTEERQAKIERVLRYRQKDLTVVMDNVYDAHNVSAIYRSCDAFGVPDVHLYYTTQAFPDLSKKTSASARKWVTTKRHGEKESLQKALVGYTVLATSCTGKAKPMYDYDLTKPTAFIMGNEHSGVDAGLLDIVDGEVYIPMYGMIQSFNVSVAAALLLGEASRQRLAAGMYEKLRWTEEEYHSLLATWLEK